MAHQSLYRRYRPARFSELRGQEPVVRALQNAVKEGRVGHAYLFSGPRGTGKTSTARILAKALNCTDPAEDGEPCGQCQSCVDVANNVSYDLIELDAASNNKVDDVRDLISKVAMGSPGKVKVYVLDEVHMLTAGAENALLKTLEEPPSHVVFVLCTTEPHKVVPTIRSRTQHLEFSLIDGDVLADHVRWVINEAGLEVDDSEVGHAVQRGKGSARDTLSALDQIVAAGGVSEQYEAVDAILEALGNHDSGIAFVAVNEALKTGRDPRVIGETLLDRLRNAFLWAMGADLSHLTKDQQASASATAERMQPAGLTRALDVLGTALIAMRQAPDPRVDLEVALARLTRQDLDTDVGVLLERLERLERLGPPASADSPPVRPAETVSDPTKTSTADKPASAPSRARAALAQAQQASPQPPDQPPPSVPEEQISSEDQRQPTRSPQPTLGALRANRASGSASDPAPPSDPPQSDASVAEKNPPASNPAPLPSREDVAMAWGDVILPELAPKVKTRFGAGRFLANDDGHVVFALPNESHLQRCEEVRTAVDDALRDHFHQEVPLRLTVDDGSGSPPPVAGPDEPVANNEDEVVDLNELIDADPNVNDPVSRVMEAFPGSEVLAEDGDY